MGSGKSLGLHTPKSQEELVSLKGPCLELLVALLELLLVLLELLVAVYATSSEGMRRAHPLLRPSGSLC